MSDIEQCEWCGSNDWGLDGFVDSNGIDWRLCPTCLMAAHKKVCRHCGTDISNFESDNGLCKKCSAIDGVREVKERDEEESGMILRETAETPVSTESFKESFKFVTVHSSNSSKSMVSRLFAISKMTASGINNGVILANVDTVQELIGECEKKHLIRKEDYWEIIILGSEYDADRLKEKEKNNDIIAHKGKCYFVRKH